MYYVGLDVSGKNVVAVWKDKDGGTVRSGTYENNEKDLKRLAILLQDCRVAVEASTSGAYVYDCLSDLGIHVVMANPSKIKLIAESDKKTDHNDADVLANLLRVNLLPTCYVPPQKVRIQRNMIRQRAALVETNTKFKNKIRAILAREGIRCPCKDVFGKDARKWLDKAPLSPQGKEYVQQLLALGDAVLVEIGKLNDAVAEEHKQSKQAVLLDTIPGVSRLSAVTILSEVGDASRFPSPKKLCSYAGIVPRVHQSGEVSHAGHIKQGSRILKNILVQDANAAIGCSRRFRKFYLKLKRKKGHQKAIVAVARKMLTIAWFMLQRNRPYEDKEAALCGRRAA